MFRCCNVLGLLFYDCDLFRTEKVLKSKERFFITARGVNEDLQ